MSARREGRLTGEPPPSTGAAPELKSGGGGGTLEGMDARVIRLEERTELFAKQFDRILARLDAMDEKLVALGRDTARLPTREFLIGSLLAVFGAALAVAALTFNIADYAAKQAVPEQRQAAAPPVQQPIVIVLPSAALAQQSAAPVQPAPSPPIAPGRREAVSSAA